MKACDGYRFWCDSDILRMFFPLAAILSRQFLGMTQQIYFLS